MNTPAAEHGPVPARHWLRGWWWPVLLLLGLGAQGLATRFPDLVERLYAQGLYPFVVRLLTDVSQRFPVSLAEVLLLGLVVVLAAGAVRGLRRWRRREATLGAVLKRGLTRLLAASVVLYVWYLLAWGLLHQRADWATRHGLVVQRPTDQEVEDLARALLKEAVALRPGLPELADGSVMAEDRQEVLRRARLGYEGLAGVDARLVKTLGTPRDAWTSPLFSLFGGTGVYVPFTGEPHVNGQVPASELPFVAAHELAHQLGVAREDEASLLAVQSCRRHPDRLFRYAGAWTALRYVLTECRRRDPELHQRLVAELPPGILADAQALRRFWSGWESPASDLGRAARDAYLRSQGTEEGVQAYDRLVDLLVAEARQQRTAHQER